NDVPFGLDLSGLGEVRARTDGSGAHDRLPTPSRCRAFYGFCMKKTTRASASRPRRKENIVLIAGSVSREGSKRRKGAETKRLRQAETRGGEACSGGACTARLRR